MTRSRTIAIAGLTAGLLAGGGVGLTMGLPSVVGAQTTTIETTPVQTNAPSDHSARLRAALQPLVDGGTITPTQLDAVVAALEAARPTSSARSGQPGGHHGHRGGPRGLALATIAPLLGSTADQVATALRNGTSIAAQAEAAGVPLKTIVDALVGELAEHLAAEVAAGEITQAQADATLAEAPQRITTMLEQVRPAGEGPRGMGPRGEGGMRRGGGRF